MVSRFNLSSSSWQSSRWQTVLLLTLAFWFASSLMLDGVVMPALYSSGMMAESGFAIAGYSLFWVFNRVELICAAIILTSVLVLHYCRHPWNRPGQISVFLSLLLVAICLTDTYGLTPQMGALGLRLNWFNPVLKPSVLMDQFHVGYWSLESLKFLATGGLLWLYNRPPEPLSQP
jgi:hypothetical protein